jgi:hypothetical protein
LAIDTLLEELAERGWLLNNLFQLDNGTWQCNLRTATHHTAYAQGETAVIALDLAIDAIGSALETVAATSTFEPVGYSFPVQSQELAALLANLRKPAAPVFRRKL